MSDTPEAVEKRGPAPWTMVVTGLAVVGVSWAIFDSGRTRAARPRRSSTVSIDRVLPDEPAPLPPAPSVDTAPTLRRVEVEAARSPPDERTSSADVPTDPEPVQVAPSAVEDPAGDSARLVKVPAVTETEVEQAKPILPADWTKLAGGVPFVLGYEKGLAAAKASGKPPMFFFAATWCGVCRKMGEVFVDNEVVKALVPFTPVIVDATTEKEASRTYGVSGIPNVVFAELNGTVVVQIMGHRRKTEFLATVKDAAAKLEALRPKLVDAR